MINHTFHANKRCQQRGIAPEVIELLIMLGSDIEVDKEATKLTFNKHDKKRLLKILNKCRRTVEKAPYIVLSHSGKVITAAHTYN